jgi:hypothetical protein
VKKTTRNQPISVAVLAVTGVICAVLGNLAWVQKLEGR